MTRRWWLAAALLVAPISAQVPSRDRVVAPVGSGAITGVVVSDDANSRPLRRASVMLSSGLVQVPRTFVTDDEGRFAFGGLAAGNYTLVAQKATYVPAVHGAKTVAMGIGMGMGVPIAVLEGQRVTGITLRMMKGGVVAGTVRLPGGRPAAAIGVQVLLAQMVNGRRRLTMTAVPGTTDDRGMYRVFGLPPGEYVVQAVPEPQFLMQQGELRQVSPAEVRWADQLLAQAKAAAGGVGASDAPAAPDRGPTVSYSTIYFPGTAFTSDAAIVKIAAGEERLDVDFSMSLVPTAKLSGQIMDVDGQPAPGAQVSLALADADSGDFMNLMMSMVGNRAVSRPDGTFSVANITPGRYTLTVRSMPKSEERDRAAARGAGAGDLGLAMAAMGGLLGGGGQNPATLWALDTIEVNGTDRADLVLRLQEGMTVAGSIAFEHTTLTPPADMTRARVSMSTAPAGGAAMEMVASMMTASGAPATKEGTFVAKGVIPGRYRLDVTVPGRRLNLAAPGTGWVIKSIMWKDRDLADVGLEVKPGESVSGVVVTLTDRPTEVTGIVRDQAGRPSASFPMVVFSTNRAHWTVASRRVQQAQPASDGRFTLVGLPAGEYYVCAVTEVDPKELYDPLFLESLVAASIKLTLSDGEKKTQDLKLAGG